MKLFNVKCTYCGKPFRRSLGLINQAKKYNWRSFCNIQCLGKFKNKQKVFKCGNPDCNKTFVRTPHEIPPSRVCFCSASCAATINNKKFPKRKAKVKKCPKCNSIFTGGNKYCSIGCVPKTPQKFSKRQILNKIRLFYRCHGRIPLKRECSYYRAARLRFATWNKAIQAADFKPNPVKFARKRIAFDGHKCDSYAEFVIDNWLTKHNIPHQIHIPYPNTNMICDFMVGDLRIEFVGLEGENKKYDKSLNKKRKMILKEKYKVIEICPKDLFPYDKLSRKLNFLLSVNKNLSYAHS